MNEDKSPAAVEDAPASSIDTSKMSEGKRQALELTESAREGVGKNLSFAPALFFGQFPFDFVHPYPAQSEEDQRAGEQFLGELREVLRDKIDPDSIDRDGEIPEEAIEALRSIGAFGIKIPKEYGGLGLSQTNYSRAAILLGSHCGNTTALLSAHQSIGVPQPLLMFGTPEQKKRFLPELARGAISAFALTEYHAGSDPAKLSTRAEPTPDGRHYVLNGEKLWCTNGTKARYIVVMARTPTPEEQKKRRGITAFIVDAETPGVELLHRCHFMGLRSLYNGVIRFTDVKVPAENVIAGLGKGLRVALTTLNTGRLTLPNTCVGLGKRSLELTRRWASEREQWGAPIGKHAAIAEKIAEMTANIYAMEAMSLLTSGLADRKDYDFRVEAAMCKMWCSEVSWEIANEALQIRGGRGYETARSLAARGDEPVPLERNLRDARINLIFEGSSEIMRLFIAREALDPHLKLAGEVLSSRAPTGRRLRAALRAGVFYAGWYPRQWLPLGTGGGLDPALARHVRYASRTSRKLARRLFHAMIRFGPKLDQRQPLLARYVEIGTELFAIACVCSRAHHDLRRGEHWDEIRTLVDYFCRGARRRVARRFRALRDNDDTRGYRLAQSVLDGDYEWLEAGTVC